MKPAAWRAVLVTTCGITALGAVMVIFCVTGFAGRPPWSGHWGVAVDQIPFGQRIADVRPAGPADRAGLHAGDRVDLRQSSLQERYWFAGRAFNGRPVPLSVRRGPLHKKIVVVPTPIWESTWQRFFVYNFAFLADPALAIWLAFFASLIAWRRSGVPEMRVLALALITYSAGTLIGVHENGQIVSSEWTTPWLWPSVAQDFISDVIYLLTLVLWIELASWFARPFPARRRILKWLCLALIAAQAVLNVASSVGVITLWYDWNLPIFTSTHLYYAMDIAALLYGILSIAASHGAERRRSAWVLVPLGVLLFLPAVAQSWVNFVPLSYYLINVSGTIVAAILFLAPAALTYAALSRRLIDIGFVLNRSVVFAIVSAIVILTFIGVEWAAGAWLNGLTRTSSALIGLCVALVLGLSLRYIHAGVDSVVDRVLFRKRHEDETALRRFAQEAAYITDRATLLERTVREVRDHTRAQDVSILLPDGAGSYVATPGRNGERLALTQNDPGITAMRAWHKPIDIHSLEYSGLRGEFAFPMVSRGALVGVLVCGPKRDGESYAPDESDALNVVAQWVGAALDTMTSPSVDSLAALREAIVSLQDAILAELRAARNG
ncbi:MAG: GAF domain-containing protein [Candidatus Eremiobacteraeota bacterium]|nr:GAF domain-containing protein [Candidatus Eremiobacteraeota bacterium]